MPEETLKIEEAWDGARALQRKRDRERKKSGGEKTSKPREGRGGGRSPHVEPEEQVESGPRGTQDERAERRRLEPRGARGSARALG